MDTLALHDAPTHIKPISHTLLQKIWHALQKILGHSRSPQEIYKFCVELTNIARNEFLNNQKIYMQEDTSQLYIQHVQEKITARLKKDWYFKNQSTLDDSHSFMGSSHVNWILPDDIKNVQADRIHPINPDKYYSVNWLWFILHMPAYDVDKVLDASLPIQIDLVQNGMKSVEEQYEYMALWDVIVKHIPGRNELHIDIITLIKETAIADKDCYDGLNYRKLVWIAKPFAPITTNNILPWTL